MTWRIEDNPARAVGIRTLSDTIDALRGRACTTERDFKASWLDRLSHCSDIVASGWYSPPPDGITVLTATPDDPARLAYSSLRSEEYWPSDRLIDWQNGLLLAYCSAIDKVSGLAGDIAITLYFGSESRIKDYFRRAHFVVGRLLDSISNKDTSLNIIDRADAAFADKGLRNCVTSITDKASYNVGHTIPQLNPELLGSTLSEEEREQCRTQRRFLNRVTDWPIASGGQFSIEPQIRSATDEDLPQLTFHYLVRAERSEIRVCRDVDSLLVQYGLAEA
jgi:hypothetical protein